MFKAFWGALSKRKDKVTKAVYTLEGEYISKKITAIVPVEYKNGEGFNMQKYLDDKGADYLMMAKEGSRIESCHIGWELGDTEQLVITDIT